MYERKALYAYRVNIESYLTEKLAYLMTRNIKL